MERKRWLLYFVPWLNFLLTVNGRCPTYLPVRYEGGLCLGIQIRRAKHPDGGKQCKKIRDQALFARFENFIPEGLVKSASFILGGLVHHSYWMGMEMKDNTRGGSLKDRKWTFLADNTAVVQKDFKLWHKDPSEDDRKCTIMHRSEKKDEFKVKAVECGVDEHPVVCQKVDKPCSDSKLPYLEYGDNCFAVVWDKKTYDEMKSSCQPNYPAALKDEAARDGAYTAVLNAGLGGASLIDAKRADPRTNVFLTGDGKVLKDTMWAKGEPREGNDCVGFFIDEDGTGKLRTVNCDLSYSLVCGVMEQNDDDGKFFLNQPIGALCQMVRIALQDIMSDVWVHHMGIGIVEDPYCGHPKWSQTTIIGGKIGSVLQPRLVIYLLFSLTK